MKELAPPPLAIRLAAPAAALVYPGLVWCGSRTSPVVLATTLAVPLLGLVVCQRLAPGDGFPRARRIAHLVVAAPPLFSLLGGWLDFQHVVPFGGTSVWIALWGVLIATALLERSAPEPQRTRARGIAMAHGVSAAVIALYSVAHLGNHLGGLFGGDMHVAIMQALRIVYRHPVVEPALFAAVGFQVVTGVWLLHGKLARSTGWFDTLQTATGSYLLVFLLSHVSAVLRARHLHDVDTNWTWLSGGELLTDPWSARLVPYYFLSVIAFGVHAACGLRTVMLGHGVPARRCAMVVAGLAALATLASALILVGLFRA